VSENERVPSRCFAGRFFIREGLWSLGTAWARTSAGGSHRSGVGSGDSADRAGLVASSTHLVDADLGGWHPHLYKNTSAAGGRFGRKGLCRNLRRNGSQIREGIPTRSRTALATDGCGVTKFSDDGRRRRAGHQAFARNGVGSNRSPTPEKPMLRAETVSPDRAPT